MTASTLAALARELGYFVYRSLRWVNREEVPAMCAELMGVYAHGDVWREAIHQLGARRRLELSGFARRQRLNLQRRELAEVLETQLRG